MLLGGIKIYRESAQTRTSTWYMDEINVYGSGYNGEDIEPNWGGSRETAMQDCVSGDYDSGGGGGSAAITKGNPDVKVENGKCVLGTIAAAIQFRDGGTSAKAIEKAAKALDSQVQKYSTSLFKHTAALAYRAF